MYLRQKEGEKREIIMPTDCNAPFLELERYSCSRRTGPGTSARHRPRQTAREAKREKIKNLIEPNAMATIELDRNSSYLGQDALNDVEHGRVELGSNASAVATSCQNGLDEHLGIAQVPADVDVLVHAKDFGRLVAGQLLYVGAFEMKLKTDHRGLSHVMMTIIN